MPTNTDRTPMPAETHPRTDAQAVDTVIHRYLEWARTGAEETLNAVFHPDATVVNASNGDDTIMPWTLQAFAGGVEALRTTTGPIEETAKAVSVDVAGNIASVKIEFDLRIGPDLHTGTEYLTLARLGDRWLITQKIYDSGRPYVGASK